MRQPARELIKSTRVAYILWLLGLIGFCGIHRIYAERWVTGLIWFFTVGLLGIGQIIDLFLIPSMVRDYNTRLRNYVK